MGRENWNDQIVWKLRTEILDQWELFEEDIASELLNVTQSMEKNIQDLCLKFDGRGFLSPHCIL